MSYYSIFINTLKKVCKNTNG